MTKSLIVAIIGVVIAGAVTPGRSNQAPDPDTLWQSVLAAKGGAARLRTVASFAVSLDTTSPPGWQSGRVAGSGHHEIVVQLPDRVWRATDYRPARMGLSQDVWNATNGVVWRAWDGAVPVRALWNEDVALDTARFVEELVLVYFGEARGFTARPAAVRTEKGRLTLELATSSHAAVQYVLDQASLLPRHVILTPRVRSSGGSLRAATVSTEYEITDHQTVDGLQVPRTIRNFGVASLIVNPDVDAAMFKEPAAGIRDTRDWRKFLKHR